jgi:hypothetical protein
MGKRIVGANSGFERMIKSGRKITHVCNHDRSILDASFAQFPPCTIYRHTAQINADNRISPSCESDRLGANAACAVDDMLGRLPQQACDRFRLPSDRILPVLIYEMVVVRQLIVEILCVH